MNLYVLRHGLARERNGREYANDDERPVTAKGCQEDDPTGEWDEGARTHHGRDNHQPAGAGSCRRRRLFMEVFGSRGGWSRLSTLEAAGAPVHSARRAGVEVLVRERRDGGGPRAAHERLDFVRRDGRGRPSDQGQERISVQTGCAAAPPTVAVDGWSGI